MILRKLREEVVKTGVRILETGLVTLTWGNISAKDEDTGYIAITPSGMDYNTTAPDDIVVVDSSGKVIDGIRKPSSEMPMHLKIYEARPKARAIVHTHSIYATAIGVAGVEIPLVIGELANAIGGSVRVAPLAMAGTEELGDVTVEAMKDRTAVLMKNHGVVTIGKTLDEAFTNAVVVEDAAKIYYLAKTLGCVSCIPDDAADELHKGFLDSYGQK
ncbi:MAG: class II aldolase/adducin family protein [Lutispora sp.]